MQNNIQKKRNNSNTKLNPNSKMASATNLRQSNMQSCQLHCLLTLLLQLTTETATFSLTN